jgi:hypothetical protein
MAMIHFLFSDLHPLRLVIILLLHLSLPECPPALIEIVLLHLVLMLQLLLRKFASSRMVTVKLSFFLPVGIVIGSMPIASLSECVVI